MFDLITIGDCTWDTFLHIENASLTYGKKSHRPEQLCLPYAQKLPIEDMFESMGGNAANVAVGVNRLGFSTAIVSEIGLDMHSCQIYQELKKNNVNISYLKRTKNRKTRFSTILNFHGERTILSYFEKIPYTKLVLPKTKNIFYTSLGHSFETQQKKIIHSLKKNPQTRLICNPGTHQLKEKTKNFAKILRYTDVLFLNKEEAEILVGPAKNTKQLFQKIHDTGVKIVVITDGVIGSSASNGENIFSCGIYHVPIVSKTGAGDAYASAFVSALLQNCALAECMLWGTANAASVTGHLGAQTGLLTAPQIKKFIKEHPLPQAVFS